MAKEKIYVGETKLPDALHTIIIARFLKTTELKQFWDAYSEARFTSRDIRPPTEIQVKMAEMRKKIPVSQVAKELGVPGSKVRNAVIKVALWNYLNK